MFNSVCDNFLSESNDPLSTPWLISGNKCCIVGELGCRFLILVIVFLIIIGKNWERGIYFQFLLHIKFCSYVVIQFKIIVET